MATTNISRWSLKCIVCLIGTTLYAVGMTSVAKAQDAGALNREIERSMPSIQRAPEPQSQKEQPPVAEKSGEEKTLSSEIKRIDVQAPRLKDEVENLLRLNFLGKLLVTKDQLNSAKTDIWSLFREGGKLAHIELSVLSAQETDGGSAIRAVITEMRIRKIIVVKAGNKEIDPAIMERIYRVAATDFAEGTVLDIDDLTAHIKRRMYLRDIAVHASLDPVDTENVDINVIVGAIPPAPTSILAQYDNQGNWAFGADRFIGGIEKSSFMTNGDRANAIMLKTMDIGGLDVRGVIFGRALYEVPSPYLGVRFSIWGSLMRYHADNGVTASTNANGDNTEIGVGVHFPIFMGDTLEIVGHTEFLRKTEKDRLQGDIVSADKDSKSGRLWVEESYALGSGGTITGKAKATIGDMDLSSNADSFQQDQAGPKVDGIFAKYEGDVKWMGRFGTDRKIDTRFEVYGQMASKNLDSMEKLSLGGVNGLRAFSPSEASGDEGYIATSEVGYWFFPWLRAAGFYEVGGVARFKNPYSSTDTIPNSYVLQDAGVSLVSSYKFIDANLSFAHQIGRNPGLSSAGYDADNTKQRFRIFASLSYRY